ncbi:MAG: hypothetical protein D3922_14030, partial [Candidatus Electrothrix sp. AR1]|nr:hypothetical protein [Candidatus Electrothrix sp. AR1]
MKKVCLVKGGDFVLGIEARYILSRQHGMLPQETASKEREIFHLGALLARKHCERPEPGSVFLQLHKGENTFFLLVDQVIDEIELPKQTTCMPPPSPELAKQLCPQVAICMNLVVLLLDPCQVFPVARKLGPGVGLLAAEHWSQTREEKLHEEPPVPVDCAAQQPTKGIKSTPENAAEAVNNTGPVVSGKKIKKNNKRPKSVDEQTFKRV